SKGLDLIVANDITASDAGFGADTNRVLVIDAKGDQEEWPLMSKYEVAWRILDRVHRLIEA
ncbi:MAG TPA: phosphopantothenoylcysteine decarboxylase, partial [Dehalococcoidia bacterium]